MHILITDSGVGGLSVVAYAERFVRTQGVSEPVHLTFANAAPANDYGYNSMPTREAKVETFERFLHSVNERFAPDSIYVACNTLSVLLPDTPFFRRAHVPVKGIVETGANLLVHELAADPQSTALIFGTPTTIEAGTYPRMLLARGVASSRIVSQACVGLADTISEDREGSRTAAEIQRWVDAALTKVARAEPAVIAYLACTHYGYRSELFEQSLLVAGAHGKVLNPNERAVDDLFGGKSGSNHEVDVQFVTRYPIPDATVEALTYFLSDISPRTVAAMQHFVHIPDLF